MDHGRMTLLLRELAEAAEANRTSEFRCILEEILNISAADGMSTGHLDVLAEELCREFGMDVALGRNTAALLAH